MYIYSYTCCGKADGMYPSRWPPALRRIIHMFRPLTLHFETNREESERGTERGAGTCVRRAAGWKQKLAEWQTRKIATCRKNYIYIYIYIYMYMYIICYIHIYLQGGCTRREEGMRRGRKPYEGGERASPPTTSSCPRAPPACRRAGVREY